MGYHSDSRVRREQRQTNGQSSRWYRGSMSLPKVSVSPFTRAMSTNKKGERDWNGKRRLSKSNCRRLTRARRKLQEVLRDLAPLKMQGEVEGFFNNVENAAQLGGLVEGIRDAMMEYQVCTSNSPSRHV